MNTESPEKKSRKSLGFIIPVVIIILLIAGLGYFVSTQTGLDEKAFTKALDDWSASLEEYSANEDTYMHFEYESLSMAGGVTDRHAIITNPRFETEIQDEDGKVAIAVETSTALVYPTSVTFNKARIILPEAINVESDEEGAATITTNTPLEIEAELSEENGLPFTSIDVALPTQTNVIFLEEEEEATITMDEGGVLHTKFTASDRNLGIFNITANNVVMLEGDDQFLTLGALNIESEAVPTGENRYDVAINASAKQLYSAEKEMPYGAIDAAIKMDYNGPLQQGEDQSIDWVSNAVTLSIPTLFVKAGDVDISATVDAKTLGQGDPFPIGNATINVQNLPFVVAELEKNEILGEADKKTANALLSQAVGHRLDNSESLELTIARTDGGSLTIGQIPFEQALGIILTSGMTVQPQPSDHDHSGHHHATPEDDGISIEDAAAESFKKLDNKGGTNE